MNGITDRRTVVKTPLALALSVLVVATFPTPGALAIQGHQSKGGSKQGPPPPPPAHARRETVRTPNFVPRSNGGTPTPSQPPKRTNPISPANPGRTDANTGRTVLRRTGVPATPQVQNQRKFTKTPSGRKYDNGLQLRRGTAVSASWQKPFFPRGHFHFPYYRPSYIAGSVFISPFGFYFGVCAPFIDRSHCREFPPTVMFIDVPNYAGANCTGYVDDQEENYFDRTDLDAADPGLLNAVDELSETFQGGNIDALIALIDPNMSVAVYLRGRYVYSLAADDFVDLTRDAIQSTHTVEFSLTTLRRRGPSVFCVSGTHTYLDNSGARRIVYVSYVLQDVGGQWTLTQVGTAPDRIQKWR